MLPLRALLWPDIPFTQTSTIRSRLSPSRASSDSFVSVRRGSWLPRQRRARHLWRATLMCHIFGRESSLSRHRGFDGDEAFVDGIDAKAEGLQRSGADQDERVRLAAQDHGRDFRTIDRDVPMRATRSAGTCVNRAPMSTSPSNSSFRSGWSGCLIKNLTENVPICVLILFLMAGAVNHLLVRQAGVLRRGRSSQDSQSWKR